VRELTVFLPLAGDPDECVRRFESDPSDWLPAPAHQDGPLRWRYRVRALGVSRKVSSAVGQPVRIGRSVWRTVTWEPRAEAGEATVVDRALPALVGELGLSREDGRPTLVLTGDYEVPLGGLGETLDAIALHRVARTTAEAFLQAVAENLRGGEPSPAGDTPRNGNVSRRDAGAAVRHDAALDR
jgi:hypothetical protein